MLDTDTKRRIDTARDILVGKVPDPKSQVEQITIALIYKFMDDMDADAEELGGKRKFFTGEFARYGWARLMSAGIGGHELIGLYGEGISTMPQNPGIPALFRDIFKNAYLPYRDPETLKSFLKIIDEFSYDHSERLGDAFEYLLSVLGSQGDAGQFRTPRHIIDFMVEVMAPQKGEAILDPACGTAGFLISAWKHILRTNTDAKGHSTLTPDEKGRLATNFKGYDISPDMVRLSLVNLYLHGFTDPHIYEYDTLTSEDRWNEFADVILANPPFMSPKGGIKPHKRFSIQAKRSEVLFVDYMAEHLTPTGRAGIIVPEGIIFQSQTAYKDLRKMLVENSLVAVISLPAGVFQPYSGVKTSILILDKSLAKQTNTIAFFKVENDGFGLGAQRRATDGEQLTQVQAELAEYLRVVRSGQAADDLQLSLGLVVAKEKITANGEHNLSGERYREGVRKASHDWPIVDLSEIIDELESGVSVNSINKVTNNGEYGILKTSCVTSGVFQPDEHKTVEQDELTRVKCPVRRNSIIISRMNTEALVGANAYIDRDYPNLFLPDRLWQTVITREDVDVRYLQKYLASERCRNIISAKCGGTSGSMKNISKPQFLSLQIPLPPLDVQKEIVAEIEGYQKVINGARAVLDNYRPHIPIDPEWPMVELGEVCKPEYGFTEKAMESGNARFVRITDISESGFLKAEDQKFITLTEDAKKSLLSMGDILVARTGATFGKTMIFEEEYAAVFASFLIRLRFPQAKVLPKYYWVFAQSDAYWNQANALMTGGGQPQFNGNALIQIKFPLPPFETQQAIVAEIEAEQELVNANRELIERFEKKIQATLARVWGEDQ